MAFVEVKTSELIGEALNWAVAKAQGWVNYPDDSIEQGSLWHTDPARLVFGTTHRVATYKPSTSWAQCGPLILEYQPALIPEAHDGAEGTEYSEKWYANIYYNGGDEYTTEPCLTPLIAACRAIVATVFGDTVSVPAELIQ